MARTMNRHTYRNPKTGEMEDTLTAEQYDEMIYIQSEQSAELRNEQFWEDRGWEDALDHERWEDSRGVVQFSDALAESDRIMAALKIKKEVTI